MTEDGNHGMGQSGRPVAEAGAAAVLGHGRARAEDAAPDQPHRVIRLPARGDGPVPTLGRAALPLVLQLPGRSLQPRGPGRRGGQLACGRWPSPTTTACTGCPSSRRRPRADGSGPAPGSRRSSGPKLSLDLPAAGQGGVPDPVGQHLLVLARDPDGYRRLCRVISAAQLRGGEKGRPVYDLNELAQEHDGHWVILTGCRKGAVPAALAAGGPGQHAKELERPRRPVRRPEPPGRADRSRPARRRRTQRRSLRTGPATGTRRLPQATCTTPPGGRPACAGAGRGPGPAQPGRDGRLAGRLRAAYLRSGAEMDTGCAVPRGREHRRAGADCAFDFGVIAPRLPDFPVPGRHRGDLAAHAGHEEGPLRYGPQHAERVKAPTPRSPASSR